MQLTREEIQNIKKLRFHCEYDQIYHLYGSKAYQKYVPKLRQLQSILRLKKAHNYDLIYKKHGKDYFYNRYYQDIVYETGNPLKSLFYKYKKELKDVLVNSNINIVIVLLGWELISAITIFTNSIDYAEEIAIYNQHIEEYAKEFDASELNDLEIVEKIVDEIHEEAIYGTPELDLEGYWRLDILNGVGVCRNMADDFTTKMNAINPDYQAKTCCVYTKSEYSNTFQSILAQCMGNHAVVLMHIPNSDIILVVDPTNEAIGVLKNGQLYSFSNNTWELKCFGTMYGMNELYWKVLNSIESFFVEEEISELEELYGIKEQQEALRRIRQ